MALKIRTNTPVSFQILINHLRLFSQDSIISNEELEMLDQFKASIRSSSQFGLMLQINYKELLNGAEPLLQSSTNNNKYLNMMVIQQEEETEGDTLYLLMPS